MRRTTVHVRDLLPEAFGIALFSVIGLLALAGLTAPSETEELTSEVCAYSEHSVDADHAERIDELTHRVKMLEEDLVLMDALLSIARDRYGDRTVQRYIDRQDVVIFPGKDGRALR